MISSKPLIGGNTGCVKALRTAPGGMQCRRADHASAGGHVGNLRSGISANAVTCRDAGTAKDHAITQGDEAAASDLGAGVDQQEVRRS